MEQCSVCVHEEAPYSAANEAMFCECAYVWILYCMQLEDGIETEYRIEVSVRDGLQKQTRWSKT